MPGVPLGTGHPQPVPHQFPSPVNLRAAYDWIERSRSPRTGGARAFYTPLRGWSRTYPQVTGCLIPTIIRSGKLLGDEGSERLARTFGEFLLEIQHPQGAWHAGMWPPQADAPLCAFGTAQIIQGFCALHRQTNESQWIDAASRAARWLMESLGDDGFFVQGASWGDGAATYQTQVAWPMLELSSIAGERRLRDAAIRILHAALSRRTVLGAFTNWGFKGSDGAFTHTIGFVLRGFLESARLLGDWPNYGKPLLVALRRLADDALSTRGRLPGAYDCSWHCEKSYTCLTGNAQIAVCLLSANRYAPNDRFPRAARKLIEEICRRQLPHNHPIDGLRGAIPGSYPIWGRYLPGRYPVWAAKYLCDAIIAISADDYASFFNFAKAPATAPMVAFTAT